MEIILPENVIESNLETIERELKRLPLEKPGQALRIDLSNVKEIDFFGFQYIYLLKDYLLSKKNYDSDAIEVTGKTELWEEFENQIGLKL